MKASTLILMVLVCGLSAYVACSVAGDNGGRSGQQADDDGQGGDDDFAPENGSGDLSCEEVYKHLQEYCGSEGIRLADATNSIDDLIQMCEDNRKYPHAGGAAFLDGVMPWCIETFWTNCLSIKACIEGFSDLVVDIDTTI